MSTLHQYSVPSFLMSLQSTTFVKTSRINLFMMMALSNLIPRQYILFSPHDGQSASFRDSAPITAFDDSCVRMTTLKPSL